MYEDIKKAAETLGFTGTFEIAARRIPCDASLRRFCEQNVCGSYGTCYMCPPAEGSAETLIAKLHNYKDCLIFTKEYACPDMANYKLVQISHERRSQLLWKTVQKLGYTEKNARVLTTGGCHLCEECGIKTNEPCRHPDMSCPSVSGYCVKCGELADMLGINMAGENGGIVFFAMVLLK